MNAASHEAAEAQATTWLGNNTRMHS